MVTYGSWSCWSTLFSPELCEAATQWQLFWVPIPVPTVWRLIHLTNTAMPAGMPRWLAAALLPDTQPVTAAPLTSAFGQRYPSCLAHCLPTCNSPPLAQHTSLVLIHTHSHPKLPSSVMVRADSGGRQVDEWRPSWLPEQLTLGLWA